LKVICSVTEAPGRQPGEVLGQDFLQVRSVAGELRRQVVSIAILAVVVGP
jgi:hypothetical protein